MFRRSSNMFFITSHLSHNVGLQNSYKELVSFITIHVCFFPIPVPTNYSCNICKSIVVVEIKCWVACWVGGRVASNTQLKNLGRWVDRVDPGQV